MIFSYPQRSISECFIVSANRKRGKSLKEGNATPQQQKKKNRRGQNRDDLERPRDSNRINPVNIEESHPFGISLLSSTRPPLPSLSPPIPIGCSVEMPSRNHPSRLIESLTLMNIGSDRRARGTLFSPCLFPLPFPRVPDQRNPAPCRRCRLLACSFARVITRPPLVDRETWIGIEPSYPGSFA